MKTLLIASFLTLASGAAFGADLDKTFADVCASPAIKSEKLTKACTDNTPPEPVKAGDRFKNVGIGSEINTLSANLAFFVKA